MSNSEINVTDIMIAMVNARSVLTDNKEFVKSIAINEMIIEKKLDFLAITETWLSRKGDSAKIIELTPQNYSFVHSPRLESRGGGVGFVFNSCYTVKVLPQIECITSFDLLRVRVCSVSTRTFYVYVLYRPPVGSKYAVSDSIFYDDLDLLLSEATMCVAPVILMGDFNIHYNKLDKSCKIRSLCDIYAMVQHVHDPTHTHGNTLDLVISSVEDNLISSLTVYDVALSDHYMVEMHLNIEKYKEKPKYAFKRCLRNIDIETFKSNVAAISDRIIIDPDISACTESLNMSLQTLINEHAPQKRICIKTRPHPWYNNDIHQAKLCRRTCERAWGRQKCVTTRNNFVSARNYVTELITHRKTYYHDKLVNGTILSKRIAMKFTTAHINDITTSISPI